MPLGEARKTAIRPTPEPLVQLMVKEVVLKLVKVMLEEAVWLLSSKIERKETIKTRIRRVKWGFIEFGFTLNCLDQWVIFSHKQALKLYKNISPFLPVHHFIHRILSPLVGKIGTGMPSFLLFFRDKSPQKCWQLRSETKVTDWLK